MLIAGRCISWGWTAVGVGGSVGAGASWSWRGGRVCGAGWGLGAQATGGVSRWGAAGGRGGGWRRPAKPKWAGLQARPMLLTCNDALFQYWLRIISHSSEHKMKKKDVAQVGRTTVDPAARIPLPKPSVAVKPSTSPETCLKLSPSSTPTVDPAARIPFPNSSVAVKPSTSPETRVKLSPGSTQPLGNVAINSKLWSSGVAYTSGQFVQFILGISGGDCAGKKELINFVFEEDSEGFYIPLDEKGEKQRVTIIHQDYFLKDVTNKFNSRGIDWQAMELALLCLLAGNTYMVKNAKLKGKDIELKPHKLIVIEGSHVFMPSIRISQYIFCKIFVDSDSDVRVSRRIFKDTQDDKVELNASINNYLQNIKPSYEKEIEPCKAISDIIIPHFGGGYNDHRTKDRKEYATNISNVKRLIAATVKEAMEGVLTHKDAKSE